MKVLSVCGGIEMLADALRIAGITPTRYWSIEIDARAREMTHWRFDKFGYGENGGIRRPCDDLCDFEVSMLGGEIPDLVVAGIPCQSMSMANSSRRGAARLDGESGLIFDFVRRVWNPILALNPHAKMLVENVPSAFDAVYSFARALMVAPVLLRGAHFSAQDRDRLFYANFPIAPRPTDLCRDTFLDIAQPPDCAEVMAMKRYDVIANPSFRFRDDFSSRRIGVIPTARTLAIIAAAQNADGKMNDEEVMRLRGEEVAVIDAAAKSRAIKCGDDRPLISASNAVTGDGKTKTVLKTADKVAGLVMTERLDPNPNLRVWDGKSPTQTASLGGRRGVQLAARINLAVFGDGKSPSRMSSGGIGRKGVVMCAGVSDKARPQQDFVLHDGARVRLPEPVWVIPNSARLPTCTETERLFGLMDGATAKPGVSRSARIRLLGNGFIAGCVAHALARWRETPQPLI